VREDHALPRTAGGDSFSLAIVAGFDDTTPSYYRGADTGRQAEHDAFTALGVS
jgi:hypothetical protein